jgi:hypothetical protein
MPSNIIWENFGNKLPYNYLIDFMLNVLLFFSTIILSSPLGNARMIKQFLDETFDEKSNYYGVLLQGVGPLAMAFFNSFFIPTLVFYTTEYLFFELKSQKVRSKMMKMYFYLMMNTVFLPITRLEDISSFLKLVSEEGFREMQKRINDNLIQQSQFFLNYLLTTTFLSQCIVLLDLPHWYSTWSAKRVSNNNKQNFENLKKKLLKNGEIDEDQIRNDTFRDIYSFDIGFNIAINQIVYTVTFIYAIVSPTIALLGAMYFGIKYVIDKYNLTVLYPKDYESNGEISSNIYYLADITLVIQQFIMFGLFVLTFQR